MSEAIGEPRHTKKTRRARHCDWCGEMIEVGQPKVSWLWKDVAGIAEVRMHPECSDACAQEAREEGSGYVFSAHEHARGCCCERGACRCDKSQTAAEVQP